MPKTLQTTKINTTSTHYTYSIIFIIINTSQRVNPLKMWPSTCVGDWYFCPWWFYANSVPVGYVDNFIVIEQWWKLFRMMTGARKDFQCKKMVYLKTGWECRAKKLEDDPLQFRDKPSKNGGSRINWVPHFPFAHATGSPRCKFMRIYLLSVLYCGTQIYSGL